MTKIYRSSIIPSLVVFLLITLIFMLEAGFWDRIGVNHRVVEVANILLYILSSVSLWMHFTAIKNPNPHVFTRSVMGGTVLKLFILGIAVVVYLLIDRKNISVYAIFMSMILYIFYTILDVRSALLLNKK